jgi:hypothetical protein
VRDRACSTRRAVSAACPNLEVRNFRDLFVLRAPIDDGIVVDETRTRRLRDGENQGAEVGGARKPGPFEHDIQLNVPGSALAVQAGERIAWPGAPRRQWPTS